MNVAFLYLPGLPMRKVRIWEAITVLPARRWTTRRSLVYVPRESSSLDKRPRKVPNSRQEVLRLILRELVLLHQPRGDIRTARRRTKRPRQGGQRQVRPVRRQQAASRHEGRRDKVHALDARQVTSAEQDVSDRRKALSRVCRFFGEEGRASQQP